MKNCLECSEKIVGREDKKFCSDGCRNSYNNKINKDSFIDYMPAQMLLKCIKGVPKNIINEELARWRKESINQGENGQERVIFMENLLLRQEYAVSVSLVKKLAL